MKRTLKRESKVLEIVRREAIGTGGSRNCSDCSVAPLSDGPAGSSERFTAPVSRARPMRATHSVRGRASIDSCARWLTGTGVPVKGSGGLASRPCPAGTTRCACRRRDRGNTQPMPARGRGQRVATADARVGIGNRCPCAWSVVRAARVHLRWVSDAGGNGADRPVLKHGPRSLTRARVSGWQTWARSESGG